MTVSRRAFLSQSLASGWLLGQLISASGADPKKPKILLRSSWQTVNIGDIAHTPGVLTLLEKQFPEATLGLWPSNIGDGVQDVLKNRFPQLNIVRGPQAVETAFEEYDFLLHGSGPFLVAARDVARWHEQTGKPYGIYGISLSTMDELVREGITNARFSFFRDTVSLKFAKENGAKCPVMEFGPDGAFAVDLADDEAAQTFLQANGLEKGKFLCCIGRLRYTPYWKIRNKEMTAEDKKKHQMNESKKEQDHLPLREAIVDVVRKTGLKVLVCPEDQSQMAVGKELLVDPLPDDVKKSVVWREKFWLADEAVSVYRQSAGLFGNEMHSPIMCIGNGIPAIVCRWAEQTSKGYMWRDIGLDDWLFNMDEADERAKVPEAVLAMASDPEAAKAKAEEARNRVLKYQAKTMEVMAKSLS